MKEPVPMVPVAGLEPARHRWRWILSPLRLPIPSHRHGMKSEHNYYTIFDCSCQEAAQKKTAPIVCVTMMCDKRAKKVANRVNL